MTEGHARALPRGHRKGNCERRCPSAGDVDGALKVSVRAGSGAPELLCAAFYDPGKVT